jgi:putative ABC transport system permease protein
MSLLSAIRVALGALLVNKGRSILTSLGIVIGIMAVIAMVSAGSGARQKLDERLASVGKNLILIKPGARTLGGAMASYTPLTSEDAKALRDDPVLRRLLVGVAESQHLLTLAQTPTASHHVMVTGNVPAIREVRNWKVAYGRFFDESDMKQQALVCLIGETVRKKLFPHRTNPVGERVRIASHYLEVIGMLGEKGRAPNGDDQDNQVFVPLPTLQRKLAHEVRVGIIVAATREPAVEEGSYVESAKARIQAIMRERHRLRPGQDDDFEVSSIQEVAQLATMVTTVLNLLIIVIASISLVVGGIGIMNIMLVSVTERTREIGIRMAVGATPADIRNQFLIEAAVLAMAGGIIGISLGIGVAVVLGRLANWPIYVSPMSVALAFGVSAAVGVFFGYYPAAKASRLDPIEALRYE